MKSDVYKRQVDLVERLPDGHPAPLQFHMNQWKAVDQNRHIIAAVSYTHLDVYKRQAQSAPGEWIVGGMGWNNEVWDDPSYPSALELDAVAP